MQAGLGTRCVHSTHHEAAKPPGGPPSTCLAQQRRGESPPACARPARGAGRAGVPRRRHVARAQQAQTAARTAPHGRRVPGGRTLMWRARFWRRTAQDSCALGAAGAWASGSLPLSPKCSPAPREIAKRKVFRNLQFRGFAGTVGNKPRPAVGRGLYFQYTSFS